jgi:hypothetical protein
MAAGGRRYVPTQVRVAVTGFNAIGGIMFTLALTGFGVLLSGMQVDPVRQGGTNYLDFVLFFNAVLFLFPLAAALVFLGVRIKRGEHWAWLSSLVFLAFIGTMAPLLTWLLPAPLPFAVIPALCSAALLVLLLTPPARAYCADREEL